MNLSIEEKFVSYCINKKIYVNLAESCTGGLISSKITSVSNASQIFKYSFITYNNESKHEFLKVPVNILNKYGAVSKETAFHMAKGLANEKGVNFSFAVTGIAGPLGGTKEKPVGLVFFSFLYNKKNIIVEKKNFKGGRNIIREKAANYALKKSIQIITLRI